MRHYRLRRYSRPTRRYTHCQLRHLTYRINQLLAGAYA